MGLNDFVFFLGGGLGVVVEEGEEDLGAGVFVWCFFFVWGVRGLIKRGDVGVWGRGVKCIWGFGGWGWG